MKLSTLTLLLLLIAGSGHTQQQKTTNKELTKFLIRQVILTGADSGTLVLMKLPSVTINQYNSENKLYYWDIVSKYHTGMSKEALDTMVDRSLWVDTSVEVPGFRIQFKGNLAGTYENGGFLAKKMANTKEQTFIISVSNPIFSPDGDSCVLFVVGYQLGAYTVEIFKDPIGKWGYKKVYGEWLE
jgi:hypothetical protein